MESILPTNMTTGHLSVWTVCQQYRTSHEFMMPLSMFCVGTVLLQVAAAGVIAFGVGFTAGLSTARVIEVADDDDEWEDIDSDSEDDSAITDSMSSDSGASLLKLYPGEPCKMVFLIRKDLKMEKGKIAAQCGHATLACYKAARKYQRKVVERWEQMGQAKIALKIDDDKELETIMMGLREAGVIAMPIRDAGRTQVAAGSRTVLGIGPAPLSAIDMFCSHLKLL
eukprot:m.861052 g.861052  ORF g.861052 m.861052 type:complete len:225 (+) comp23530_c2_seq2:196-870(+)